MSYQVGFFCYASPVDAGTATCSRFSPVSIVSSAGTHLVSTSCESVNVTSGALQLRVATTDIATNATTYQTVEQLPAYFPCQEQIYWDFAYYVIPLVLVICVSIGAHRAITRLLNTNRGENT